MISLHIGEEMIFVLLIRSSKEKDGTFCEDCDRMFDDQLGSKKSRLINQELAFRQTRTKQAVDDRWYNIHWNVCRQSALGDKLRHEREFKEAWTELARTLARSSRKCLLETERSALKRHQRTHDAFRVFYQLR